MNEQTVGHTNPRRDPAPPSTRGGWPVCLVAVALASLLAPGAGAGGTRASAADDAVGRRSHAVRERPLQPGTPTPGPRE